MEAYHSNCPNFHSFKWRYYSVAIRFASAEFDVAVMVVGWFYFILLSSILLPYNLAMAADSQIVQKIIVEHTEVSITTTKMEYFVPDPSSLQLPKPVGRANRCRDPQPAWLPLDFQDVNSLNNPDILSQNAFHPSGILGTCQRLDNSLLNTTSHLRQTLSNLDASHPPVNADFVNTNQSVPEQPTHNGVNIQHSFATSRCPSYATSYSNVNLQNGTTYSNLPEPQATLPTSDFDLYGMNDMGGFTIKEESLDSGLPPYTVLPHQQPLNIANYSSLYPTMTVESYSHSPLCPFPNIEPQGLPSSGTSASLNMLTEQRPMSNMFDFHGNEYTTASTGSETSIPPYVDANASVPSGREHFNIHATQESSNERRLPSDMVSSKSQTGPSNSPSHGCAASLYLPKIEDSEDIGPLMDTAMQITPETSNYNDLDDSSPQHHLFPGACNSNTANLSDDLPICHTINDHLMQENLDSSSSSVEPPCIANDASPNTRNIREASTHADAPVNADSDTSVKEDTPSAIAELDALFTKWTKAGDYVPNCSSTRETSDVNAANPYNVNNGNNTVATEPNGSQHVREQVIKDAGSEETQPQRRKYRSRKKANLSGEMQPQRRKYRQRKKANLSEEMQPQRRKYRPRKMTNILLAEVGHSHKTEVHDDHEDPNSRDRRTDPEYRYFCIDKECKSSGEMGYHGFPTNSETVRHINYTEAHREEKRFHCPLLHPEDEERLFHRADGLGA